MASSTRLLRRSSYRYLQRHRWQLALSVLGVALGVAVAVSVDLSTGSAQRAFELSTEALTGTTTHQIVAGSGGLSEAVYRHLRVELDVRAAAPIVEGYVALARDPTRVLRVLGIDPLAVAIPAGEEHPISYDAAFSDTAHGKIRVYEQKGLSLPEGWALDGDGVWGYELLRIRWAVREWLRIKGGIMPASYFNTTLHGRQYVFEKLIG